MSASAHSSNYDFLNALRGWAAMTVAVFHLFLNYAKDYPLSALEQGVHDFFIGYFDLGKCAVGVFFMVSGFLIPSTLNGPSRLRTYVMHRFWRLYPAYWISLAVLVLSCFWFVPEIEPNPTSVLANITMLQGYLGQPDLIGVYWTLQIEITFYFMCGLLYWCRLLGRRKALIVLFLLVALICAVARWQMEKKLPVAMFIALVLMFTADTMRHRDSGWQKYWWGVFLGIVPICCLAYGEYATRYAVSYFAALVIFRLCWHYGSWRGFSHPIFGFLSAISYSLYLLHMPIGNNLMQLGLQHHWPFWLASSLGLGTTLLVAYSVYHWVEAPCMAWARGRKSSS
jgi:peptidoglycan/LPS O-acetylase OafA/YrhL